MDALDKIKNKLNRQFHICVGLDTDYKKIPKHLHSFKNPVLQFNKEIIDSTKDISAAYKLNFAFYENLGAKGFEVLLETVEYIPDDILIIGDAKRGDIGNTSSMYAKAIFEKLKFDAVTLSPYMGKDSISPFLEYKNKINFVLALTSNKSSEDFEKLVLNNGNYLYREIIKKVCEWNEYGNCGIVFGATNLEELKSNISEFRDLFILIPGIGAQGGSLEDVVSVFYKANNQNFILNISRSLIYADSSETFAKIAKLQLENYNKKIKEIYSLNC